MKKLNPYQLVINLITTLEQEQLYSAEAAERGRQNFYEQFNNANAPKVRSDVCEDWLNKLMNFAQIARSKQREAEALDYLEAQVRQQLSDYMKKPTGGDPTITREQFFSESKAK